MFPDAVLIAGPTASGKSALAMELAEHLDGTIVNADSMQVYADLAVLTARPSASDEMRVPHRLYGHVKASERYSVGRYQREAAAALAEARSSKRIPIFTGGTGLYFDALMSGLSPIPAVPADIRDSVRRRFDAMGREAFFGEFARHDPASAARLRASDTQRILRAAAVLEGRDRRTGRLAGHAPGPRTTARGFGRADQPALRDHGGAGSSGGSQAAARPRSNLAGIQGAWHCSASGVFAGPGNTRGCNCPSAIGHAALCEAPDDLVPQSDEGMGLV